MTGMGNRVADCDDCIDPVTGKISEEICKTRRINGVCPQLPVIEKLKLYAEWLAESWRMDADPREMCGVENPTVEDILAAAERQVCHE